MKTAKVFRYTKADGDTLQNKVAPRYATREAIAIFEAVLIEGTGCEVDASLLDGNGTIDAERVDQKR